MTNPSMIDSIFNSLVKSGGLAVASMANAATAFLTQAHLVVAMVASMASAVFAILSIVSWFQARSKQKQTDYLNARAVMASKTEGEEKQ